MFLLGFELCVNNNFLLLQMCYFVFKVLFVTTNKNELFYLLCGLLYFTLLFLTFPLFSVLVMSKKLKDLKHNTFYCLSFWNKTIC